MCHPKEYVFSMTWKIVQWPLIQTFFLGCCSASNDWASGTAYHDKCIWYWCWMPIHCFPVTIKGHRTCTANSCSGCCSVPNDLRFSKLTWTYGVDMYFEWLFSMWPYTVGKSLTYSCFYISNQRETDWTVYCCVLQDREFVELDNAYNGAANKPSTTPPLTPTPSIISIENSRRTGCCARRPSHKKYQVSTYQGQHAGTYDLDLSFH